MDEAVTRTSKMSNASQGHVDGFDYMKAGASGLFRQ
jgi:hypothetical protein